MPSEHPKVNTSRRRRANRDTGIALAAVGIPIVPTKDKKPVPVEWPMLDSTINEDERAAAIAAFHENHGFAPLHVGSTLDTNLIREWMTTRDFTPSVSLGAAGLVVLDLDVKAGVDGVALGLKWLEENNVDISQCPRTRSQSGGLHVYFSNTEDVGCGRLQSRQWDLKGKGGQVVAAGAIRDDGKSYILEPGAPSLVDAYRAGTIPPIPPALVDVFKKHGAVAPSEINVTHIEERPLTERLRNEPWPDPNALFDSVIGFDLDALAEKDPEFRRLITQKRAKIDTDKRDESASGNRWNLAKTLVREFGNAFDVQSLATAYEWANDRTDSAFGVYTGDVKPKEGEYDNRQIVREWLKLTKKAMREINDGAAFGAVNDNDESDTPPAHYLKSKEQNEVHKARKAKAPIMLDAVDYDSNIRKIVAAMRPHVPLYIRGRELVTVATIKLQGAPNLPGETTKRHDPETSAFVPVKAEWLQARATRYLDCRRMKPRGRGASKTFEEEAAPPPEKECKLLIASPETWNIPVAHQIIEAPFLTPEGNIVSTPGFHAESGLYLAGSVSLPEFSKAPSRDDAARALSEIDTLLDEFPFVDEASRSGALSMILTLLARNLADVVPLHAITAPSPGTGKSELGSIATRISHGRQLPAQAADNREGELAKRIETAVRAGHPVIALDNVNGTLAGDVLCQVISQPVMTFRVMGGHGDFIGTNRASVIATGNNLRLPDDMVRRSILISLDAGLERPEHRQFKRSAAELNAHIAKNRGQLIGSGLTVIRAFIHALVFEEAEILPPFAGFAAWSAYVRSPLVWLGRADPLATQASIAADDPEGQKRAAIFAAWHILTTGDAMRASDAIRKADALSLSTEDATATNAVSDALATLREHVPMGPGRRGDEALAHAIGYYFRRQKGVIAGGLRLVSATDRDGLARWQTSPV